MILRYHTSHVTLHISVQFSSRRAFVIFSCGEPLEVSQERIAYRVSRIARLSVSLSLSLSRARAAERGEGGIFAGRHTTPRTRLSRGTRKKNQKKTESSSPQGTTEGNVLSRRVLAFQFTADPPIFFFSSLFRLDSTTRSSNTQRADCSAVVGRRSLA